jgi:acyl-CoA synthetase (AMP-forming)/AMP-acid ligase II
VTRPQIDGSAAAGNPHDEELAQRSDALHAAVRSAIRDSVAESAWDWGDPSFDALARDLFEHQYRSCAPYGRYCEGRGVTPSNLGGWQDIPAVPTEVFKSVDLFAFPPDQASTVFLTSGTRFGQRGRHLMRTDATYVASLALWLDRFLLCGAAASTPSRVYVLAPPAADDPASSLSHMLQWAHDERGGPGSRFFWSDEGPALADCAAALLEAAGQEVPVLMLATAGVLQALMESTDALWTLPAGSVVMETGGPKRSDMEFDRGAFHRALAARFGLPLAAVVSEYGMTELGSQGYSPSWLCAVDPAAAGRWPSLDADLHVFPPWCRVRALDPDDLRVLPVGERGLLCFWDLSNVDSILCVLTADEGVVTRGGVRMLGRSPAASPRGCSLAVEEILGAVP